MKKRYREEFICKMDVESGASKNGLETTITMQFSTGRQFVDSCRGGINHKYEDFDVGDRVWVTMVGEGKNEKITAVSAF